MAHRIAEIVSPRLSVRSRRRTGRLCPHGWGDDYNHRLAGREAIFLAARDSFYMASVSETGWPTSSTAVVLGFVKVLDERTIGFADYAGNRQYVSIGNVRSDNRVALFFSMDYPNRRRLKMLRPRPHCRAG
ncbi:MAG: pyridoxamine 5'-phosphate oxidase family protein [Halioglobus sp.]